MNNTISDTLYVLISYMLQNNFYEKAVRIQYGCLFEECLIKQFREPEIIQWYKLNMGIADNTFKILKVQKINGIIMSAKCIITDTFNDSDIFNDLINKE